jgi:hypothetical protein
MLVEELTDEEPKDAPPGPPRRWASAHQVARTLGAPRSVQRPQGQYGGRLPAADEICHPTKRVLT